MIRQNLISEAKENMQRINELIEFLDRDETHEFYKDKIEDVVEKVNEIIRCINFINNKT